MDIEESCKSCIKQYVCKFKPDPYMGTASGGFMPNIPYTEFKDKLETLYGTYCIYYETPGDRK